MAELLRCLAQLRPVTAKRKITLASGKSESRSSRRCRRRTSQRTYRETAERPRRRLGVRADSKPTSSGSRGKQDVEERSEATRLDGSPCHHFQINSFLRSNTVVHLDRPLQFDRLLLSDLLAVFWAASLLPILRLSVRTGRPRFSFFGTE